MTFNTLAQVVAQHGFEFETAAFEVDTLRAVGTELRLPDEFLSVYWPAGPAPRSSIPWVVEELFTFAPTELAAASREYAGPGWAPQWIVVAAAQGDPYFADVSLPGCPVYAALHGGGSWAPMLVADALARFVDVLVAFEEVLLGQFDLEVWDDDDALSPVFRQAVQARLGALLPPDRIAGFVAMLE